MAVQARTGLEPDAQELDGKDVFTAAAGTRSLRDDDQSTRKATRQLFVGLALAGRRHAGVLIVAMEREDDANALVPLLARRVRAPRWPFTRLVERQRGRPLFAGRVLGSRAAHGRG